MADYDKEKKSTSSPDHSPVHNEEKPKHDVLDVDVSQPDRLNAVFENPLAHVPDDQLMLDVEEFCQKYDMMDSLEDMKKGAKVSKYPHAWQSADWLDESEKEVLRRERTNKWDHPWMLYWLCTMCSLAAATQGMDETANNGALPIYTEVRGWQTLPENPA